MARQSRKYFIEEKKLKQILSNGDVKICIAGREINKNLRELHVTDVGEDLCVEIMWHLIIFGPYWWPTCGADINNLCSQKCTVCSNQTKFSKDPQTPSPLDRNDLQITIATDWRRPYMEYLTCKKIFDQTLPPEVRRVMAQSH